VFSEGDAARAIELGKIKISKVDLSTLGKGKRKDAQLREMPVRLPPTALRVKYFSRLLALPRKRI